MKCRKEFLELEIDTLGFYLDRALNVMIKKLNRLFNENNINIQHAQYIILKVLWCQDGLSQSQLAKILDKDPAAISRALKYLEEKGYVKRQGKNGTTNSVYLTTYADSRRNEIETIADLVTQQALMGLPKQEHERIKILLTSIFNHSK